MDYMLDAMGWLPEVLGASRENHIMRSSAVVTRVTYDKGRISYTTFDAPANTVDVLRLAFKPGRVTADNQSLEQRPTLDANGYQVKPLTNGDCIVTIRHDGKPYVTVEGDDPQIVIDDNALTYAGPWSIQNSPNHVGGAVHFTWDPNAEATCEFEGNQVRLIGPAGPEGGLADVYLDGVRQLCGLDCWNPYRLERQVVWYRGGLKPGKHALKVASTGQKNPLSKGTMVWIDAVQYSAATGDAGAGSGGGPTDRQAWIFGYPERQDYVDSQGHAWRPATEVVIRAGQLVDPVKDHWYTTPRRQVVADTNDPKLYCHGMHGKDFTAYVTCGPGTYHVRLKFMEHRLVDPDKRAMDVYINGRPVVQNLDIAATAAGRPASVGMVSPNGTRVYDGMFRAVDLVFNDTEPSHGVIAVRFVGCNGGEAIVSAIEVAPGPVGPAARPITATAPTTMPEPRR
jgi:hypothetical protein